MTTASAWVQLLIKGTAQKVEDTLIARTPIDTGEARRGYHSQVNKDGFVIENNVPHIVALEDGHSQQAPQGFNKITCMEAPQIVATVIQTLPNK